MQDMSAEEVANKAGIKTPWVVLRGRLKESSQKKCRCCRDGKVCENRQRPAGLIGDHCNTEGENVTQSGL